MWQIGRRARRRWTSVDGMHIDDARAILRSRAQLEAAGLSTREITARVRAETMIRVDRGWYADAAAWGEAFTEGRHLMRVIAADARRTGESDLVYSHTSAVVMWPLPLFRIEPKRVHLSGRSASGHVRMSNPLVARHEVAVPESDVVEREGLRCTSLPRTVADMLRGSSAETGLALADAALRLVAHDDATGRYDDAAATDFRAQVAARLPRGGRGVRAARRMLELADGRAASPGESVSRLYLLDLGFASPRLQVAIPAPTGAHYYVDFGIDDADAWGEYDGEGKYLDPALRGTDVDIAQVVLAEKMREDWIRGTTNRKFPRWGKAHTTSAAALGARLAAFSVYSPR